VQMAEVLPEQHSNVHHAVYMFARRTRTGCATRLLVFPSRLRR